MSATSSTTSSALGITISFVTDSILKPAASAVISSFYTAAQEKVTPVLHPLITIKQLGELYDREDEALKIKFHANILEFVKSNDVATSTDKSRSRDDVYYLEEFIDKCLKMYPPTCLALKIDYARAIKGLETLAKRYSQGDVKLINRFLQDQITKIEKALLDEKSREDRILVIHRDVVQKMEAEILLLKQRFQKNENNSKAANSSEKAAGSNEQSAASSKPQKKGDGFVFLEERVTKIESAISNGKKELEHVLGIPEETPSEKAFKEKIKSVFNEVAMLAFYDGIYKLAVEEDIKAKTAASQKKSEMLQRAHAAKAKTTPPTSNISTGAKQPANEGANANTSSAANPGKAVNVDSSSSQPADGTKSAASANSEVDKKEMDSVPSLAASLAAAGMAPKATTVKALKVAEAIEEVDNWYIPDVVKLSKEIREIYYKQLALKVDEFKRILSARAKESVTY